MRFMVYRTSDFSIRESPCEEAFMESVVRHDVRTWPSWSEITNQQVKDTWYDEGSNHREEDGCIVRDMEPVDCWFVDLNTMEDMLRFVQKHGEIVISQVAWTNRDYMQLEIYDDYRE